MNKSEKKELLDFYIKQLKEQILPFWILKSIDSKNGGFFNCFNNEGTVLVSTDKYTWSQGRFVWLWTKLASLENDIFSQEEREYFLSLARSGVDFLKNNCLIAKDDYRCVFLMDEAGNHKFAKETDVLDSSIFADCFVVGGFSIYSKISKDYSIWEFTKKLYTSIRKRLNSGKYYSLPYPLGKEYKMHSIPMIWCNIACEMYKTAKILDPDLCVEYKKDIEHTNSDILNNFIGDDFILREIINKDNTKASGLLGEHINPGHILEDIWFQMEALDILNEGEHFDKLVSTAKNTLVHGWDKEYGGYLHFVTTEGKIVEGSFKEDASDELQLKQVYEDWDSKLWWVHSEALYTSLLLYFKTKDTIFLEHYKRIEEYVFETFPNKDEKTKEWIQIRTRDGRPQDKVVALPVKDPYHIIRNYCLIIELLGQ